jgi:tetratricopeptide (TPR) repeat protein
MRHVSSTLSSRAKAAEQRLQAALAIVEELGDRSGVASSYHELGFLAQVRGDYDAAEQRYQDSLAIDEELGNRSGVARSYHQLGMLAQDRGDYDAADQRYQTALAILKELGEQASTASTLSELGILHTRQSQFADAIRFQLQSLAIRTELGLAHAAAIDMQMLREQRTAVGDKQFLNILQADLDADIAAAIMRTPSRLTKVRYRWDAITKPCTQRRQPHCGSQSMSMANTRPGCGRWR